MDVSKCKKFCGREGCKDCFSKSFASHEKSKMWSERNELKPYEVFKSSGKKYQFECDICSHTFSKALDHIQRGSWCPYCVNQKLCEDENCQCCFEKSFASDERSIYWNIALNKIDPRMVFKNSNVKYNFDCKKCGHIFSSVLNSISNKKNPTWCPYCSHQKLCNDECKYCFENSFASNEKSQFLLNKEINPRLIPRKIHNKYEFICNICNHTFFSDPGHISEGKWCPYCCWPRLKICKNKKCEHCQTRTFSSHEKSKFWSENNKQHPSEVFIQSPLKYEFKCSMGHYFKSPINNIVKGQWCPFCKNKTEKMFLFYFYRMDTIDL